MFKPCLEIPNKRKKAFDSKLCIVCQKIVEKPKRGPQQKKDADSFNVFIDTCKSFVENGDQRYLDLQNEIKNKTAKQLSDEGFCFHTKCRSDFQKISKNHKRSSTDGGDCSKKESTSSSETPRVSRQETISFDKNCCLFCQIDIPGDSLLSVRQTSRDQTLKDAFYECPSSLALYNIRSSHAYDAMAGDIKYHRSCWRTIIDNRIPEIQPKVPQSLDVPKIGEFPSDKENDQSTSYEEISDFDQSHLSHEKSIELRNGRSITLNEDDGIDYAFDSYLKEVVVTEIIEGLKLELSYGRGVTMNDIVSVYKVRMAEHGLIDPRTDKAIRIEFQRIATKRVCEKMDSVVLEKHYQKNQSQRIMTTNTKAYALKYAEENILSVDKEIAVLKQASMILRRRTLKYIKEHPSKSQNRNISVVASEHQFPPELTLFVEGVLYGQRELSSNESIDRKVLVGTISASIMHNIKTDRQVNYVKKRKTRQSRRKYIPQQMVALALSMRHCERNNSILRLLSAPNIGLSIPPRTALLFETMIANAMIKLAEEDGVYIPPNMERGVRVSFHIDNFDEQVLTFDGKDTVHYLLIVCFQRRTIGPFKPMQLELEKTTSLKLKEHSFGEIIPCDDPSTRQFKRTKGCMDVTCASGYVTSRSSNIFIWQCLRSFEHIHAIDERASYISLPTHTDPTPLDSDNQTNDQHWTLDSLKLPSFSATSSLVVSVDLTLTNIFSLPFVPGPASSTSAVYTSLDIAHKTNVATSSNQVEPQHTQNTEELVGDVEDTISLTRPVDPPPGWKSIIVLDLDLYSKAYKLVHSRRDLRDRYVLCLGELHIVFAGLRAIGSFIDCSGLDDSWMSAKWFDSESLLRQVKDCSNMKRALATHEATFIAVQTLILQETLIWHGIDNWRDEEIFSIIKSARDAFEGKQTEAEKFQEVWNKLKLRLQTVDLEEKIKAFIMHHKHNPLLQFLSKYCNMVIRLFTFIEATRSRNWQLHLDALEDMIPDFASMNRINYRRLSAVYVADMRNLETDDIETWKYFAEGNFCCQKNAIPYTAIGRDHCGEQENKVLKGRGGVSGQSSNSNSTMRYFMTAPILSQMYSEMMRAGGRSDNNSKSHHQLGDAYTKKQNRWVISLLQTFEMQKVSLSNNEEDSSFINIVTGQVFSNAIYNDLIGAYDKGQDLYKTFVEERMKPESKINIFSPLKKSGIKTCKSGNKGAKIKYKDKVMTLKEENIFISRIAIIRGSRDVNMKNHIGNYELAPVIHSLMTRDGILLDGWDGKSALATRVLLEAGVSVILELSYKSEAVAIDAMFLMNQISTKPLWVKTGRDLATEFCKRVDQQCDGADTVVIGFEWYCEDSLKSGAWKSREIQRQEKGKDKKRLDYILEPDTDISKRCMTDILGTIPTKRSLTKLLMDAVLEHLKNRGVEYFLAGNGITYSSCHGEGVTNHKEGETAIILGLSSMDLSQKRVTVCGNDVDLFVLLLAHYTNIDCLEIHMKSLNGYSSITAVHNFLGNDIASALLPFHSLTGCDVTGKFSGRSKEFWTGKFLEDRRNNNFIQALLSLNTCRQEEVLDELSKFICRSYCPKKTPNRITNSVMETRYFLYKKFRSETSKLPPSPGAFLQHLKRACCPLVVWHSANLSITRTIDHLANGWEMNGELLMPVCTVDRIAPEALVELVSCNCDGDCTKGWCTCKKNKVPCTDFCGCGDECQNTDAPPTDTALNAENGDEDDEHIEDIDECTEEELEELLNDLSEVEEDVEVEV